MEHFNIFEKGKLPYSIRKSLDLSICNTLTCQRSKNLNTMVKDAQTGQYATLKYTRGGELIRWSLCNTFMYLRKGNLNAMVGAVVQIG